MPKNATAAPATTPSPRDTMSGCLVRLAWMLFGNVALFISAAFIAQHTASLFSLADLVFWTVAAALLVVRRLDIERFGGQTAMGEPATMAHWRRYAVRLLAVSLVAWALAHGIARLAA